MGQSFGCILEQKDTVSACCFRIWSRTPERLGILALFEAGRHRKPPFS